VRRIVRSNGGKRGHCAASAYAQTRRSSRLLRFEQLEDRYVLATLPNGFTETVVAANLTSPITMDIEESGRIWVAFQDGRVQVIENDALLPTTAIQLDCDGSGERGLQGIELDPDFETNHCLYVYYTAAHNQAGQLASHNRLSRLTVDPLTDHSIVPGSELVLLELPEFSTYPTNPNPIWHMGGAVHFRPDETILVQVGDQLNNSLVQNNNAPLGKVLRVNRDGTPAVNNPFYNVADTNPPGGNDWNGNPPGDIDWIDYVWASGLRNPYSGDVDPATGRYFIGDVGEISWEEINDATVAGRNFGWPTTEGNFNSATYPNFTNPFYAYSHATGCAITGGAFYRPAMNQFPSAYQGKFFFSEFCGGTIEVIDPNNAASIQPFASGIAYPMNIEFAADGSMYFIERGAGAGGNPGIGTGKVVKVQFAAQIAPQIVTQPASVLASIGYDATFSVSAAGTSPLTYQWQQRVGADYFNIDGATSNSLTLANVSLAQDHFRYRVIVSNAYGSATSNTVQLDVTTDTPPTPVIDLPTANTTYRAGDTIQFSGHATDLQDGSLAASAITWQVDFHHATHLHPFVPPTSGIYNGQFTIPANSETAADVWYQVRLVATDSAGLTTETYRDILPETSDFVVTNNMGGGNVLIDGQTKQVPYSVTGVVNVQRSLEAPLTQIVNGKVGLFQQWLDGSTNRQRTIATPENDTAYVAVYQDISSTLTFLSDLLPSNAPPPNGWGPYEKDTSNGENNAGDGASIRIGGIRYTRALGVHAASDVRYNLGGAYNRFLSDIGVDDETGNNGSVIFQVFGDGLEIFNSGVIRGADVRQSVNVNIAGVNELRLVVTDAGDGNGYDHADWANARLVPPQPSGDIYINFQLDSAPAPAGYLKDAGNTFANRGNGYSYGWSSDHTDVSRDRNINNDQRLDTLVHFHNGATWEIALPSGAYAVTAVIGDAGNASTHTLNVEGVSYWTGLTLSANEFAERTQVVSVDDGRLTLDMGSAPDKSTRIDYIEITPVPASFQLFPFASADVTLDGKLSYADVLAFGEGWGNHAPNASLEQLVRASDLNFDHATDVADWNLFYQAWTSAGQPPLSLPAVLNPAAGDYNRDAMANGSDYALWRQSFSSTSELAADGSWNVSIDAADYVLWRKASPAQVVGAASGAQHVDTIPFLAKVSVPAGFTTTTAPRVDVATSTSTSATATSPPQRRYALAATNSNDAQRTTIKPLARPACVVDIAIANSADLLLALPQQHGQPFRNDSSRFVLDEIIDAINIDNISWLAEDFPLALEDELLVTSKL
jgi:glucose/arabinose dehydrogenase